MLKLFSGVIGLLSQGVAMDFGTVNTVIATRDGVVLREPSIVALRTGGEKEVLAVGGEAYAMLGRTPGGVQVEYPMRNGVVADYNLAEAMIRHYLQRSVGRMPLGAKLMLCVPLCVTDVERRALTEAAKNAGAREVLVMDEPTAAAVGAGLDVFSPLGSMVADIGGGTTDVAVMALGGIAASHSVRLGGTHIDEAIVNYIRRKYDLMIGARTAESVKCALGSARLGGGEKMRIMGRNCEKGLPVSIEIDQGEINYAILEPVRGICKAICEALGNTPPELSGDLLSRGILLTGGGALLSGLAERVSAETGLPVRVAKQPKECVALGALMQLRRAPQSDGMGRVTLPA